MSNTTVEARSAKRSNMTVEARSMKQKQQSRTQETRKGPLDTLGVKVFHGLRVLAV